MNEILNPGASSEQPANALPQIVSQGSVMTQNVAEEVPETPDYGAMIDQALSEAMQAPANPAVQAAPSVPTQAPDAASLPNMQFDVQPAPATVTEPAAAPATEAPAFHKMLQSLRLPPPSGPRYRSETVGMPPAIATAPEPTAPIAPATPAAAPAETPAAPEAPAAAPATAPEPTAPLDPSAFQIPKPE